MTLPTTITIDQIEDITLSTRDARGIVYPVPHGSEILDDVRLFAARGEDVHGAIAHMLYDADADTPWDEMGGREDGMSWVADVATADGDYTVEVTP